MGDESESLLHPPPSLFLRTFCCRPRDDTAKKREVTLPMLQPKELGGRSTQAIVPNIHFRTSLWIEGSRYSRITASWCVSWSSQARSVVLRTRLKSKWLFREETKVIRTASANWEWVRIL